MTNNFSTNNYITAKYISSGNTIVDQLGQMDITGDITPKNLYYTVLGKDGNPNRLAIDILSHLIFCYRPSTEYNKTTDTYTFRKRFNHSLYVQKKYRKLKDLFNASEHQVRDALNCLVNLNVVTELTPPSRDDVTTNTYNNTKIDTEINTNTTTEKASVVYPESALSWCRDPYPEFTDEELSMLLDAANGDIMKVINSRKEYDKQKSNIKHPIPWIVSCIKKGYSSFTPIETPKKKGQSFEGRNYDFDKLQDWFDGKLEVKDTSELLKTGTD